MAAEPDGVTMGVLADALSLTPQSTTALVIRLEARNLARREADPADRRRTRVVLGPAAQRFGHEHLAPLAAQLKAAAERLQPTERAAVAHYLASVVAGLAKVVG